MNTIIAKKLGMGQKFAPDGERLGVTELEIQEVKGEMDVKVGDKVHVSGVSKGHGFTGVVKRHGFAGGPRTHGQSDRERAPGSSGQTTTPGRVMRGKRMAGRMGNQKVKIKNLKVVEVEMDKKLVVVEGSVPGKTTGLVTITKV